jgi:hypothetical protein
MTELGRVVEVSSLDFGSTLTADHAAAAEVLTVKSAVDFDERGGTLSYTDPADEGIIITADYLSADHDADTVTLAAGLPAGLDRDTFLTVIGGSDEAELVAQVVIDDDDEPVSAYVPHELRDKLPEGVREDDEQEAVEIAEDAGGEWYVRTVLGLVPRIEGVLVDTASTGFYLTEPLDFIAGGAWERINWPTDQGVTRYFRVPVSSGLVTIPATGRYIITFNIDWQGETTGHRRGRIVVVDEDDTETPIRSSIHAPTNSGLSIFQVTVSKVLTAGQRIGADVYHTYIGTLYVDGTADGSGTALELTYVGQV